MRENANMLHSAKIAHPFRLLAGHLFSAVLLLYLSSFCPLFLCFASLPLGSSISCSHYSSVSQKLHRRCQRQKDEASRGIIVELFKRLVMHVCKSTHNTHANTQLFFFWDLFCPPVYLQVPTKWLKRFMSPYIVKWKNTRRHTHKDIFLWTLNHTPPCPEQFPSAFLLSPVHLNCPYLYTVC